MSTHKTTARGRAVTATLLDHDSVARFVELLKLRTLSDSTQESYLRHVRKLALRVQRDPAQLDEAQLREHLLHLKEKNRYSPSSMRSAVAAMRGFYGLHLGRDWKLFDLIRSPSPLKLPLVLTRPEVARLFGVIRELRFQMVLRLMYACGLRISEAVNLEVTDIKRDGPRLLVRGANGLTKGRRERLVPLPQWAYDELKIWWKTHRHPKWVFPGVGRGWRDGSSAVEKLAKAVEPMGVGSVQHCLKLAVADARLPKGTCTHTMRHSYATHLLDGGVGIRLISAYLGHVSLDTTLIYAHLTMVNEASARLVIDQLRPPGGPVA